jgi:hypothetical protein
VSSEPVEVIVRLTSAEAQECAKRLGIVLERLHPGTSDPELATYAVAHVSSDTAEAIIADLRNCDGVEGAYAKPRGEPP